MKSLSTDAKTSKKYAHQFSGLLVNLKPFYDCFSARVFLQAWSSVSERKGGDRQTPTVRTGEREGRGNFGQSRGKVEDSVDKREHREGK